MKKYIISVVLAAVALVSCEKYETVKDVNNDFKVNFEAFWNMVNEQYCYLGYKNIDWDAVRGEMLPRVEAAKSEQEFFKVLASALDYLRDGHVAMFSPFQRYVCNTYTIDENGNKYPSNYNSTVIKENYLTERFVTMSGKIYGEIERDGHKFAYIYYSSFEKDWNDTDYKYINELVESSEGIIFDIRSNGGGVGEIGLTLAGNFFKEKTHIGYFATKNGKGHDDFSELTPLYVEPSKSHNWTDKKTVLLTNREVYSTANLFTCALKLAKNVTQIGCISGGGGGMPQTHYLPNGWILYFPGNVLFDLNKQHIEGGIEPDIEVHCTDEEFDAGTDAIIEEAIKHLSK